MIVTIHQPDFVPWYPLFKKINSSDLFVILTQCQFEKNGRQNRFFYNERWHTMSVNKGLESIYLKKYVNPEEDWYKIKENLKDKRSILDQYDAYVSSNLAKMNTDIIIKTMSLLDIKTDVDFDFTTNLKGTDRLVEICKSKGASTYLSGPSGSSYLDLEKFKDAGIKVEFFESQDTEKIHTLDFLNNEISKN